MQPSIFSVALRHEGKTIPETKRPRLMLAMMLGGAALAACGDGADQTVSGADTAELETPVLTAATLGVQEVSSAEVLRALPEYVNADRDYGDRLVMQCRACHTLDSGGGHLVGPNLNGMFGREAGSLPDYPYSVAMREKPFVWTPRALDAWLAEPHKFLPGTTMVFPGVSREADRTAVIASLLWQTAP